jgi:hypothetical protein
MMGVIPTKENFKQEYDRFFTRIIQRVSDVQFADAAPFNVPDFIVKSIQKERTEDQQRLRQAKMASLLYLAVVRLDGVLQLQEVFKNFTLGAPRISFWQTGSYLLCGEELLHILFRGVGLSDPQSCRYGCLVSRLMSVARTLSEDGWDTSFGILSYFHGIPYGISSLPELLNKLQHVLSRRS